jgi:hypothetical protein
VSLTRPSSPAELGEQDPQPEQVSLPVVGSPRRRRARTLSVKQMRRERRRLGVADLDDAGDVMDAPRPRFRLECEAPWGERPCFYVGCRHHLAYDVNPRTGGLKENFPGQEIEELAETCALDVADRGGITLEEVAHLLNLTRERVRQIETAGLKKLKART